MQCLSPVVLMSLGCGKVARWRNHGDAAARAVLT